MAVYSITSAFPWWGRLTLGIRNAAGVSCTSLADVAARPQSAGITSLAAMTRQKSAVTALRLAWAWTPAYEALTPS